MAGVVYPPVGRAGKSVAVRACSKQTDSRDIAFFSGSTFATSGKAVKRVRESHNQVIVDSEEADDSKSEYIVMVMAGFSSHHSAVQAGARPISDSV